MTPLSGRYAAPVLLMLGLAFAPIAQHSVRGGQIEDCARPELLRDPATFGDASGETRHTGRIRPKPWNEGALRLAGARPIVLDWALLRSQRPVSLYLHLHSYAFSGTRPEEVSTDWLEVDSEHLPIHLAYESWPSQRRFAVYLLVYRSEAVANPLSALLRSAVRDMIEGTPPMSILMISGTVSEADVDRALESARSWLIEAFHRHQAVCSTPVEGK